MMLTVTTISAVLPSFTVISPVVSGMNLEGRAEAVKPDDMTTSDGSFPSRMPLLDNGNFYMADGDKFLPQIKSLAQNDAESIGAILQSKSTELSRFHSAYT